MFLPACDLIYDVALSLYNMHVLFLYICVNLYMNDNDYNRAGERETRWVGVITLSCIQRKRALGTF